ncbi:Xanthan lyase [Streptomyces sp. RB5]|uniref:Xanthan lyase n=1 Tax=Streptomyces smaragdinus TaxID=2585196 RepID=A0A7K0CRR1_9ACTN|nr:polysaccharide lyase family 8 super-sandwich domain-containing protein [Streptomyces smaragdinus]MQY16149.1 Xanthan lyase [Streptomyces smaragdinus]
MELTRRRLLSALSAAGVLAVVPPRFASAAESAAGSASVLANTVAVFAGTPESNARPETAAKLTAMAATARSWLTAMDGAGANELFAGLPLGTNDASLNTSYAHLYDIALATRVPGGASDLTGNQAVQRRVIDALALLHERYFADQSKGYYGNWFNWEIGIPTSVTKTFVLLTDELAAYRPDLIPTYIASMDAYLRAGRNGDVDLDSRFHTGANLADITTNRILQGAILGAAGEDRIRKALTDQLTVFATIDPYHLQHDNTDGHYADGSFIQHDSVAYTGSYGKALLTRVVQTLKILDGTGYMDGNALVPVVQTWVRDGFAPLIFEGWMMEIVKGRAVSRTTTGYADVATIVEAAVDLAGYSTGAEADALRGWVKFVRGNSRAALNPASFVSPLSIVAYTAILADTTVPAADLGATSRTVAFNAMDKNVHRRPGYAFALARSSDRISKYEYMSGENLMPWFQGDGAYYLYLSGQDQTQAFGADYYAAVSPYALAGVTAPVEERRTIPELYGTAWYENPSHPLNFTSSSESQNAYVYFPTGTNRHSGGVTLGAYGAASMVQSSDNAWASRDLLPDDFTVYRNASATKSWFLLDDEIVVLAAGVGDEAGRDVTTAVDARHAAVTDQVTLTGALRDGTLWTSGEADLRWLRYANATQRTAVGYVFLSAQPVRVDHTVVTRSRRVVRTANPDTAVTRRVFGASLAQGPASAAYAYALVPGADEARLRAYDGGPLSVLANTVRLQAVKHTGLGLTAASAFTEGRHEAAGVGIDGPASVLVQTGGGVTTVAAADPTMDRSSVSVLLRGRRLAPVSQDERVTVRGVTQGTLIEFDVREVYGRSLRVTLR